jgi:hypothetical protein
MSEEKDKPAEPAKEDGVLPEPRMSHEELIERLRNNPHFRVLPPSGTGYVIGGQNPSTPNRNSALVRSYSAPMAAARGLVERHAASAGGVGQATSSR